jgi:hypothetical protein
MASGLHKMPVTGRYRSEMSRSFVSTQPSLNPKRRARWLGLPASLIAVLVPILILSGCVELAHSQHRSNHIRHMAQGATQHAVLTVEPTHPGMSFALGAVGLSLETEELTTRDLSAGHQSLVALMRLLGPGVLRLGGNSLDRSWWTSDGEASPAWAKSLIIPPDLVALRRLLVATNWHAILGVDLGHYDPGRAANEARVAKAILGSRLLGFEVGNEPDGYGSPQVKLRPSSYNVSDYLGELSSYVTAMRGTVPELRLYGPDLSSNIWLPAIASDKDTPFTVITEHYYPISYSVAKGACKGTPVPTTLELLSPQVRERENTALRDLVGAGEIAHRETRVSETNNTGSCDAAGGPATSPVFASALWALDWALRAASAGVAGLNFHGYFGHCFPDTVSPICAPSNAAEAHGQITARPEYYGLLAARQLEGGRFIPAHIAEPSIGGDLTVYATIHSRGTITIAIDNFSTEGVTSLSLRVPGYDKATGERLTGSSINATKNITFGHGSINAAGELRPTGADIAKVNHAFHLELGPASAMIVTLYK